MSRAPTTILTCPVRGCGLPLERVERAFRCARGHSHDVARRGHVNLLQPQDKRSGDPGDRREAVEARRRSAERGLTRELVRELALALAPALERGGPLLDVGAGDGFVLAALTERLGVEGYGVDISREAVELAARRHPALRWVIANGDRRLPFADRAFRAVISVTGPKHAAEFRRLLAPDGLLVVAVSGPDDQAELRELVLGAAHDTDRAARMLELFGDHFELVAVREARQVEALPREALRDLLDGAYRGVRHEARRRFEALDTLTVTLAHQLVVLRPKPGTTDEGSAGQRERLEGEEPSTA